MSAGNKVYWICWMFVITIIALLFETPQRAWCNIHIFLPIPDGWKRIHFEKILANFFYSIQFYQDSDQHEPFFLFDLSPGRHDLCQWNLYVNSQSGWDVLRNCLKPLRAWSKARGIHICLPITGTIEIKNAWKVIQGLKSGIWKIIQMHKRILSPVYSPAVSRSIRPHWYLGNISRSRKNTQHQTRVNCPCLWTVQRCW